METNWFQYNKTKPEYTIDFDFVIVDFVLKPGQNGELNSELNVRQNAIYNHIKKNPGVKAAELSSTLNIPFSTIDKYTRIFIAKGLIERRGSKKTGGYFVL